MTTIKLIDHGGYSFKECSDCPFLDSIEELDYGEITGRYTLFCKLLNDFNDSIVGDETGYFHEKHPNCPIISVEKEVNNET